MKKTYNNRINRNKYNTLIVKDINFANDVQSKTANYFYSHKTPENSRKKRDGNLITNLD